MKIALIGMICIVIYAFIMIGICIYSSRQKNGDASGKTYFLGTGTKTFVLLFSTLASTFSTWVFMGAPASTYLNGHTWIAMVTLYQLMIGLTCGYFGPRFWKLQKKYDFITHSDLVVKYYGNNSLRYMMGGSFVVALVTGTMTQIKAIGSSISTMSNQMVPYWAAALFVAVVVGIYVYLGGFKGMALVDTVQGLLFTVILFGGMLVVILKIGSIPDIFTQLAAAKPELILYGGNDTAWGPTTAISFCLVAILGGILTPGFWQRYYAAKDTRTLINMSTWFPILMGVVVTLTGGLVGLAANLADLSMVSADNVFQVLLSSISSPVWGILITIGVMAAGMSTVGGNLNGASLIISYDFFRFFKKDLSDQALKKIGKKCIIGLLILAYMLALYTPSSITMLVQLTTAFYMMALYPIIGIFFWKRATAQGTMAGMIGGFCTVCITNFVFKNPLGIMAGAWGFIIGMVLFVIVSLMTKPIPEAYRKEFMAPLAAGRTRQYTSVE